MFRHCAMLGLMLLIAGCVAPDYQGISVDARKQVLPTSAREAVSFQVVSDEIPAFLGPIIVSNFSVALAERGMQPVATGADMIVTLRYEQDDLIQQPDYDSLDEQLADGSETRFVARLVTEFRLAGQQDVAWQGSIERLHSISPGEYMHTGRASQALLAAFRDMLQSYPAIERREI